MRKLIIYITIILVFFICMVLKTDKNSIKVYIHDEGKTVKMDFEKYITNVVAAEMPASFHTEALKAQALAVRTYALRKIKSSYNDGIHKGADVCTDSSHCQAYVNISSLGREHRRKISSAVEETKGQIIVYNGEPVNAVFHSASHLYTERSADVWGGDVAYLQSVSSPWDAESPDYTDEKIFSADEIRKTFELSADYPLIGEIVRSSAGGIMEINLAGRMFKGTEVRQKLALKSTCFTIAEEGDDVIIRTEGHGHGVGLSQWGAHGMAKEGYTCEDIIKHYYSGTEISNVY